MHAIVEGHSTDQVEFRFIETPSIDEAEGTGVIVPLNRYRGHTNTSLVHDLEPVKGTGGVFEWTGVAMLWKAQHPLARFGLTLEMDSQQRWSLTLQQLLMQHRPQPQTPQPLKLQTV
jgi:hypothetical protein